MLSPTLYRLNILCSVSQLWDAEPMTPPDGAPMSITPLSEDNFATQRSRISLQRGTPMSQLSQSSSLPSVPRARPLPLLMPAQAWSYTRWRSESISEYDDRDRTVRKNRRPVEDEGESWRKERSEGRECRPSPIQSPRAYVVLTDVYGNAAPLKLVLRPPKLAPSAWQF